MSKQPRYGTPEYAAMMRPFVKDAAEHALAEPSPALVDKRVQSLAILIAVELSHQRNELDNLGDNESVVLVGKCPTINLMQLAEKIDAHYKLDAAALEKRVRTRAEKDRGERRERRRGADVARVARERQAVTDRDVVYQRAAHAADEGVRQPGQGDRPDRRAQRRVCRRQKIILHGLPRPTCSWTHCPTTRIRRPVTPYGQACRF